MIEMICSKEEKDMPFRELPKNVRQIGDAKEKRKIYIEDFVVTYLKRLAKPGHVDARGAILLGNIYWTAEGPAVFISGALEAQNLELDIKENVFDEQVWKLLLARREECFPGQEVVGWFLSRIGCSVELNSNMLKVHLKHFSGNHKVLYLIDALENEDAFYICENQQMYRQRGYYIYYEKNSRMQEYMAEEKGEKPRKEERGTKQEQIRRDKKIVQKYRRVNLYEKKKKRQKQNTKVRLTRAASLVVIAGTLGYAMYQMRGEWMDPEMQISVEETMAQIQTVVQGKEGNASVTTSIETGQIWEETTEETKNQEVQQEVAGGQTDTETVQNNTETNQMDTGIKQEENTQDQEAGTKQEESTQNQETGIVQGKPLYYIVQQGDTLASISRKMYTTDQYTAQIAKANELENENEIYIGQKILIPSIE
jgi:LysM repeat protein